ncbi:hypothetical protein H4R35_003388 [Dimargaris xerosporica]|nr:hypothetical protein H4R35_003388 [Dimargaris xerosporica]
MSDPDSDFQPRPSKAKRIRVSSPGRSQAGGSAALAKQANLTPVRSPPAHLRTASAPLPTLANDAALAWLVDDDDCDEVDALRAETCPNWLLDTDLQVDGATDSAQRATTPPLARSVLLCETPEHRTRSLPSSQVCAGSSDLFVDLTSPDWSENESAPSSPTQIACPICHRKFDPTIIANHASNCTEFAPATTLPVAEVRNLSSLTRQLTKADLLQHLLPSMEPLPKVQNPFDDEPPVPPLKPSTPRPALAQSASVTSAPSFKLDSDRRQLQLQKLSFSLPKDRHRAIHSASKVTFHLGHQTLLFPAEDGCAKSGANEPSCATAAAAPEVEFEFDFEQDFIQLFATATRPPPASRPSPGPDDIVDTPFTQDPANLAIERQGQDATIIPTISSSPPDDPVIPPWLTPGYYQQPGLNPTSSSLLTGSNELGGTETIPLPDERPSSPLEGFIDIREQAKHDPEIAQFLQQFQGQPNRPQKRKTRNRASNPDASSTILAMDPARRSRKRPYTSKRSKPWRGKRNFTRTRRSKPTSFSADSPSAVTTARNAPARSASAYIPSCNHYALGGGLGIEGGDTLWEYQGSSRFL